MDSLLFVKEVSFLYVSSNSSVANYKKGWNVAIKPQSASEKIQFDCMLLCEFKGYAENKDCFFELKHKANAIVDGRLKYVF